MICSQSDWDIALSVPQGSDSLSISSSTTLVNANLIDNSLVRLDAVESNDFALYLDTWSDNCGLISSDTIYISREEEIRLEDQIVTLTTIGEHTIDVTQGATLTPDHTVSIVESPDELAIDLDGDHLIVTTDITYIGNASVVVEVCSSLCPDLCDRATILLIVGDETECIVSNVVTPNNDGYNDLFRVPCLTSDRYADNKLLIFNRWGDEVYSAQPYENDWNATYNGSDLPSGTYFYILTLDSDRDPIQGFIVVER